MRSQEADADEEDEEDEEEDEDDEAGPPCKKRCKTLYCEKEEGGGRAERGALPGVRVAYLRCGQGAGMS